MSQQFQSAAVRGRGKPKECYPVFQQGCDSSQSRSWWVPHRVWAGMSCAPGLWVLMKAQARGSCAPPPTCSLCLDKKPKTIKKPRRKPGRQQGQHSQGSSAASMSQGVPGWGGQWRWPRPPGELVAGSAPSLSTVPHCWESRGEGISLPLAAPRFLSLIAGWVRKGGSLTIFQGPSGRECGHVSPSSPICQNSQAL